MAGLTRDPRQEGGRLNADAARIYAVQFQWLEAKFKLAGLPPKHSKNQTRFMMAGYHGSILLSYAQNDPSLIDGGVRLLRNIGFVKSGLMCDNACRLLGRVDKVPYPKPDRCDLNEAKKACCGFIVPCSEAP